MPLAGEPLQLGLVERGKDASKGGSLDQRRGCTVDK